MRRIVSKLRENESGQGTLAMVLILIVLGGLIIVPLLAFMGTGLKAGQMHEDKTQRYYAADAGVSDGLWQIKNARLSALFTGYDSYEYTHAYSYPHTLTINDKNVNVSIQNEWMPIGINAPGAATAHSIIEDTEPPYLVISGGISGAGIYQINITYNYGAEGTGSLKVQKIGIWLPPGFTYQGNCSLQGQSFYQNPDVATYKSGYAVVWNFPSAPLLKNFPGGSDPPLRRSFTFQFSPTDKTPDAALCWIDTTGVTGIDYTWDADVSIYEISSVATNPATGKQTEVEAYTSRTEPRKLGSRIWGDYTVIGAPLSATTGTPGQEAYKHRNRLYYGSSATLQSTIPSQPGYIPPDATVEAAYLYWSGWIDYHYWQRSCFIFCWWEWGGDISELKYPSSPTPQNLKTLVETQAKVNKVMFGTTSGMQEVTANSWQVQRNADASGADRSWSYSCFYDATDQVRQLINDGKLAANGAGTYTLQHANSVVNQLRPGYSGLPGGTSTGKYYSFTLYNTSSYTGYPLATPSTRLPGSSSYETRYEWSYAGWSLIVIYSSPQTERRQLYLFDDFRYVGLDETVEFTISGFLAPDDTEGSRLTYFVGEGDSHYGRPPGQCPYNGPESIKFRDVALSDAQNPWYNVFNSVSNAIANPVANAGIDVDTFDVSSLIPPGLTSAKVKLLSSEEIYNFIYLILSFRSTVTTGGTLSYLVTG